MANYLIPLILLGSGSWFSVIADRDRCPFPSALQSSNLNAAKVLRRASVWSNDILSLSNYSIKPSSLPLADFPTDKATELIELAQCKLRNKIPVEVDGHIHTLARLALNFSNIVSDTSGVVTMTRENSDVAMCGPSDTQANAELNEWKIQSGIVARNDQHTGGSLASQLLAHAFYHLSDKGFRKAANLSNSFSKFCPQRRNVLAQTVNASAEFGFDETVACNSSSVCLSPGALLARVHAQLQLELIATQGCASVDGELDMFRGSYTEIPMPSMRQVVLIEEAMTKLANITKALIHVCTAVRTTIPFTVGSTGLTTAAPTTDTSSTSTSLASPMTTSSVTVSQASSTTPYPTSTSGIPSTVIQTTTASATTLVSSAAPSTIQPTTIAESTTQTTTTWPQSTLIKSTNTVTTPESSTALSTSATQPPPVTTLMTSVATSALQSTSPFGTSTPRETTTVSSTEAPTTPELTSTSTKTEVTSLATTPQTDSLVATTTVAPSETTDFTTAKPETSQRTTASKKTTTTAATTTTTQATTMPETTQAITVVPVEPTQAPTLDPPGGKTAEELNPTIWNDSSKELVFARVQEKELESATTKLVEAIGHLQDLVTRNFYCPLGQTCLSKFSNKTLGSLERSLLLNATLLNNRLQFKGVIDPEVQEAFTTALAAFVANLSQPAFSIADKERLPTGLRFFESQGTKGLLDHVQSNATAFLKSLKSDDTARHSIPANISAGLAAACRNLDQETISMLSVYKNLRDEYTTLGNSSLITDNKFARSVWEEFKGDPSEMLGFFLGISAQIHRHRFALEFCANVTSGRNETFLKIEASKNLEVSRRILGMFEEAERLTRERIAKENLTLHANSPNLTYATGNSSSWENGRFPCRFLRDPCLAHVPLAFHGLPVKDSILNVSIAITEAMAHRNLRRETNELYHRLQTALDTVASLMADVNITELPGNMSALFDPELVSVISKAEKAIPDYLKESRQRNNVYPNVESIENDDSQSVQKRLHLTSACASALSLTKVTLENVPEFRKGRLDAVLNITDEEKTKFREDLNAWTGNNRSLAFLVNLKTLYQLYRIAHVRMTCEAVSDYASAESIQREEKLLNDFAVTLQKLFNASDAYLVREEINYETARANRDLMNITAFDMKDKVDEFVGQENVGVDSGFFCNGKFSETTIANSSVEFCAQAVFGDFGSSKILQILDQFARSTEKIWPDNYGRIRKTPVVGVFPTKILKVFKATRSSTFGILSEAVQKEWKRSLDLVGRFGELVDRYVESAEYKRKAQGDAQWVPNNATAEAIYIELMVKCVEATGKVKHSPILAAIQSIETETKGFNKEMALFTANKPAEGKRTLVEYWLPIAGALHANLFVADWCGALLSEDLKRERQKELLEHAIKTALDVQKYFVGAEKYLERHAQTTPPMGPVTI